ncbi:MAG TPA: hypothetical protein VHF05_01460 [Candidatus Paceibacterota bacterium]|nr:hypothetical protein [Candidatus Paceibacterota bacterium]
MLEVVQVAETPPIEVNDEQFRLYAKKGQLSIRNHSSPPPSHGQPVTLVLFAQNKIGAAVMFGTVISSTQYTLEIHRPAS